MEVIGKSKIGKIDLMSTLLSLSHDHDYRKQTHFVINQLYFNYELEIDTVKANGGPLGVPCTSSGYYYRGHPVLHPHRVLVFPRTVTKAVFPLQCSWRRMKSQDSQLVSFECDFLQHLVVSNA